MAFKIIGTLQIHRNLINHGARKFELKQSTVVFDLSKSFHSTPCFERRRQVIPPEIYREHLSAAEYHEPSIFENFRRRLDTMGAKDPAEYRYTKPPAQVIYDMLPSDTSTTLEDQTSGWEARVLHDWLKGYTFTEPDELWFTLIMEAKKFYEDNCDDEVPITNRLRLLWFENDMYTNLKKISPCLEEIWKDGIVETNDGDVRRASNVLDGLERARCAVWRDKVLRMLRKSRSELRTDNFHETIEKALKDMHRYKDLEDLEKSRERERRENVLQTVSQSILEAQRANRVLEKLQKATNTANLIGHIVPEMRLVVVDAVFAQTMHKVVTAQEFPGDIFSNLSFSPAASADGTCFMSLNFLRETGRDDDFLAFLLAHEMSHVAARHSAEDKTMGAFFEYVLLHIAKRLKDAFPRIEDARARLRITALCMRHWLPDQNIQEFEADKMGLKIMAGAGFDPRKAIATDFDFDVNAEWDDPEGEWYIHEYISEVDNPQYHGEDRDEWVEMVDKILLKEYWQSDHPSSDERINALQEEIEHLQIR